MYAFVTADIDYIYIKEYKGKFQGISEKPHATEKIKLSMAMEFIADY